MEKRLFRKNDLYLILALLFVFSLIAVFFSFLGAKGSYVKVSIDGKEATSFPLSEDLEYVIEGYAGGVNTLVIKEGCAFLKDTSCPDHLCEKMGKISRKGQSVICLPNRVVIEVTGSGSNPEYDTIAGALITCPHQKGSFNLLLPQNSVSIKSVMQREGCDE